MPLPRGLRALAFRDFRLFWLGQLASRVGTWMQSVAQAWLVLELTNSPLRLGLLSTLQFAPVLLFAFLGGILSDRTSKRRLILATQVVMMLQAFALAALVWSGHVAYWHVAVLAAIYGIANSIDMPARQAYVVELTSKDDLMNAIALNSAVFNSARVVGPALAGILIGTYGVAAAFFINGVSFLAVLAALLAMRTEGAPHPGARATMREELLQSVRYAARTPTITLVLGLLLFVSLFVLNFNVVVPLIARNVLGEGAHGYGLLMAALGGGAVLGALSVASAGLERPSAAMVVTAAMVTSAGVLALGFSRSFGLTAAILVVTGAAQIVFTSSANSTIQVTVPDGMRGRMMSFYVLVFVGVTPAGAFLVGLIAEHFGVSRACALGGAAGLLSVAAVTMTWRATARRT
ncbi:MAG TPA: MFS transporter [Methylomirabilota bacterium]|jgi:MFS family permease|nr:MFS transporter [Methylomirabilota bacterium]